MQMIEGLKKIDDKPVVIANKQGIIMFVNHKFETIFDWNEKEIIGKPISTIIPHSFHDAHHLGFSRFQSTEESKILNHPLKLKAVKKSGEIFSAEHIIQAEKINGEWLFGATITPIEETE